MRAVKKAQSVSQFMGNVEGHDQDSGLQIALDDAVKFAATYRKGKDMSRDLSDIKQVYHIDNSVE